MSARALEMPERAQTPTPGEPEKQAVRSMFDRIAPRYDLLNRVLSGGIDRGWRRAAVSELGGPADARVLDLCTGTADLLIEAIGSRPARRAAGVDLSLEMLRHGKSKLDARGLAARAALLAGDVERLPFADAVFDGALIAFGIRSVPDMHKALAEIRRVLKPGGRLVVLEFSMPQGLFGALYRLYSRTLLPRLGGLISGDPSAYVYLPESIALFPKPAAFAGMLERAGFVSVGFRPLTFGVAHLHRGERAS